MEIDQKNCCSFLSDFRLPEGNATRYSTSWKKSRHISYHTLPWPPLAENEKECDLGGSHLKRCNFSTKNVKRPNSRVPWHHFLGIIWSCCLCQLSSFWVKYGQWIWATAHLHPFKNLKWMCRLLAPERIMNMMTQSYIYIYININTKYNTIYINTISQPSKNNIKQQSSKPPSDFRWCYFTLKESPTRHFLNVLQALTEPTHPHLPLRTLEVLVDEVLFLEHLSKIFPCKTQESYIGFGGF